MSAPSSPPLRGRERRRRLAGLTVPERIELDQRLYLSQEPGMPSRIERAASEASLERNLLAPTMRERLKNLADGRGDSSASLSGGSSSEDLEEESLRSAATRKVAQLLVKAVERSSSDESLALPLSPRSLTSPSGSSLSLFSHANSEEPLVSKQLMTSPRRAVELGGSAPPARAVAKLLNRPARLLNDAKKEIMSTIQHSIAELAPRLPPCKHGGWMVWERRHALLEPGETFEANVYIGSGEFVFQLMKELRAIVTSLVKRDVRTTLVLRKMETSGSSGSGEGGVGVKGGEEWKEEEAEEGVVWRQTFETGPTEATHIRHLRIPYGREGEEVRFKLEVRVSGELKRGSLPISMYIRRELDRNSLANPPPVIGTALVYSVTWNVDETFPPDTIPRGHIDELLEQGRDAHVIAIGLQEVGFSATRVLLNATGSKASHWERAIQAALEKAGSAFSPVCSYGLSGVWMVIFVRKYLYSLVRAVKVHRSLVGLSAKGNSKGAVGIAFKVCQTRFCFLNAHLSAHQENVLDRNEDFRKIVHSFVAASGRSIYDYDVTVWMGDLNYRIDLSNEEVRRMAAAMELVPLYEKDQLRAAIEDFQAFDSFHEADIMFPPTFKYDPGTHNYDTSAKNRIPAWCDRVLWHGDSAIAPLSYHSFRFTNSDHRPVGLLLRVPLVERATPVSEEGDLSRLYT